MNVINAINANRAIERCRQLDELGPPPSRWNLLKFRKWIRRYHAIMAIDITDLGELLRKIYTEDSIEPRYHPTLGRIVKYKL